MQESGNPKNERKMNGLKQGEGAMINHKKGRTKKR
jgi:hypothetical protein